MNKHSEVISGRICIIDLIRVVIPWVDVIHIKESNNSSSLPKIAFETNFTLFGFIGSSQHIPALFSLLGD